MVSVTLLEKEKLMLTQCSAAVIMSLTKEEEERLFTRRKKKTLPKLNFLNVNTSTAVKVISFYAWYVLLNLKP